MHRLTINLLAVGLLAAILMISGCSGLGQLGSDPWPPSQSGLPTFYYFGDPG